jgi:putative FmdB family regulatory protein
MMYTAEEPARLTASAQSAPAAPFDSLLPMAVYEYRCRTCDGLFELRRPMSESDAPAECPKGHADTVRLLSVFANASAATGADVPAGGCGPACACVANR